MHDFRPFRWLPKRQSEATANLIHRHDLREHTTTTKSNDNGSRLTQPSHRTHRILRPPPPLSDAILSHPISGTLPLFLFFHVLPAQGISSDTDNVLHGGDNGRLRLYVLGMRFSFRTHVAKRLLPLLLACGSSLCWTA